jgi:hypothetical protein
MLTYATREGKVVSQDPERMKSLIAFKKRLEDRLEALNVEAKEVQAALDTVNQMLLEKGFKRGDMKEVPPPSTLPKEVVLPPQETMQPPPVTITKITPSPVQLQTPEDRENVIPLKTMNDEPLAIIFFGKDSSIHVLPDESKHFSINTPPFSNFLVEKVLAKMQEKDAELARSNQLTPDKNFTFNIVKEQDLIREIIIQNADDERLKELKSSIRWTLEKMYEKMKS